MVELPVAENAPITGNTIRAATADGLIANDLLIVSIDREDGDPALTPAGDTVITAGDIVTLFSRTGIADETLRAFSEE